MKTQLIYGYIKDNIMINDKFGMNTGIRIDQYRYKPQLSHLKYENTKEDERIKLSRPKRNFHPLITL